MANFVFATQNTNRGLYTYLPTTDINGTPNVMRDNKSLVGTKRIRMSGTAGRILYLKDASPTEPTTDGSISFTDFTSLFRVQYTTSSSPSFIKSFTSEAGIFTSNQTFSAVWNIWYQAYATGVAVGLTPSITFKFYKRNTSNSDTLLFQSLKTSIPSAPTLQRFNLNINSMGSVTTSDRLRIRVEVEESLPS